MSEETTAYYDRNGQCPHGIRKPWACDLCDTALISARQAAEIERLTEVLIQVKDSIRVGQAGRPVTRSKWCHMPSGVHHLVSQALTKEPS